MTYGAWLLGGLEAWFGDLCLVPFVQRARQYCKNRLREAIWRL